MSNNKLTIAPIRPSNEQFAESRFKYRSFAAEVSSEATKEDLLNSDYWVHVGKQLQPGDEVRCISEGGTFVAYLIVLFTNGMDVKMACTGFHKLQHDEDIAVNPYSDKYKIMNGGRAGYYVKVVSTGEKLFDTYFPSPAKAQQQIDEYVRALQA